MAYSSNNNNNSNNMSKYHEDSDADDEFERTAWQQRDQIPVEYESSPTSSGPLSTEHTPTTFTHSRDRDSRISPTGLIVDWSAEQVADFVSDIGLEQYCDTFVDEGITGDALVSLQHAELKEMGVGSVGHRLTILKAVYDIKVKQNVPVEPDDYVPLCRCPVVFCFTLSCPALPVLPCPALSCMALSCPVLPCPALSCPAGATVASMPLCPAGATTFFISLIFFHIYIYIMYVHVCGYMFLFICCNMVFYFY